MKSVLRLTALAGTAAMLLAGSTNTSAQQDQTQPQQRQGGGQGGGGGGGRGNFDPEQMRQRQMERYREQMEVKDDSEWKLIQDRIEKVTAARRELGTAGAGAFGFGRGGGGRGPGGGGDNAGGGGGARRGFGADPLPEAEALQKAIEAKASNDELKGKLAKLRDARKDKEAKLEKAQDELRKVLSVRQEAVAVVNGLLK